MSVTPRHAARRDGNPVLPSTSPSGSIWNTLFWSARYRVLSPWLEHVPFAFWLVAACRPRVIVELGTQQAVSYFAFCQAVEKLALHAQCHAVGSWDAEPPESVVAQAFPRISFHNQTHYSSFSTLVQGVPRKVAATFDDGSIDILHVRHVPGDGTVRSHLKPWMAKLSPRGVLVLHGTGVNDETKKLFRALRGRHPSFEFLHGEGLGVIGAGASPPAHLKALFQASAGDAVTQLRECFARLGRGQFDRALLELQKDGLPKGGETIPPAGDPAEVEALKRRISELSSLLDAGASSTGGGALAQRPDPRLAQATARHAAVVRENEQLRAQLRTAQKEREQAAGAAKQTDLLKKTVAEKEAALGRIGTRVAALKDEIRRSDRYISLLLSHQDKIRVRIEQKLGQAFRQIHTDTDLETARAIVLRHQRMPALKALTSGIVASNRVTPYAARIPLYLHYRVVRRRKDATHLALMASSGLFDPSYYLARYDDVAAASTDPLVHYVDFGAAEGRDPSPYFDTSFYLETYPDVAADGINPLLHFVQRGRQEGRVPTPTPAIKSILGDWTPPAPPQPRISRDALKPLPNRVVIYTAVSGGYDDLKPPAFRPKNCDFVVFSDQPIEVEGWTVRPLNYLHPDSTRAARFVKLHPHLYFPDYEHSIWIDGNIGVHGDIREFFRRLRDDQFVGIFQHPLRDCIYVEGQECIKRKKDDPEVINAHVGRYREAGFPEKFGLWETNVVVRRHNDARCVELMSHWWREMEIGSRRDQLSLPVVVQRLGVEIAGLGPPQVDARNHPMLSLVHHPARKPSDPDAVLPQPVRKAVDLDAISVDVGVCVHNSLDETRACLDALAATRRPNDGIVIVDDASDEPTAQYLSEFAAGNENVRLVRHEINHGYTASANEALKNSSSDWFVLLNSDAVVGRDSILKMIACGEQFPQIGIVGALSNAASWQTVPQLTGADGKFLVNQIPPGLSIDDMDKMCADISTGVVPFVPLVNGFCYAIRRKMIEQIGTFDEESFPQGYGEEDDLCLRAGAAGFLCAVATDAYVFHVKSATFTRDRRIPLVELGVQALRRKHTPERLKAAVETLKRHPELIRIRNRVAERLRELSPPLVPAQ